MSTLQDANKEFRQRNYEKATELYLALRKEAPALAPLTEINLEIAAQRAGIKLPLPRPAAPSSKPVKPAQTASDKKTDSHLVASPASHLHVRIPVNEPVSVIVPIYNAFDDVKTCITKLLKHTDISVRIYLINDCSTDPKIAELLRQLNEVENVTVITNEENLGFTRTVNRGIKLAGDDDVVLLNSDARVSPRWLEGIRYALSHDARIATVTPMSDRAGAFSAPTVGNENELPQGVAEDDFSIAFRQASLGLYPTVPTGNGFCMYIRRACLQDVGGLDEEAFPRGYGEENDFCMRAGRAGWRHVIDDRTYVFHDRNKSFGEQKTELMQQGRAIVDERYPEYKKSTRVFTTSPAIKQARKQALLALERVKTFPIVKPRILYSINSWTGGTPETNRDLMSALSGEVDPWVLRSDSTTVSLYQFEAPETFTLVRETQINEPLDPLSHVSHEYDAVVGHWLREFDFNLLHIRHLAWHSLNLPSLAQQAGTRVVHSFHDFYSVCPTIKLLDEQGTFCGGTCTTTVGDCKIELWRDKDALPQLKNSWVHRWRERYQKTVIDHCDAFVTTHPSVRETLEQHFQFPEDSFYVIPHGRDFQAFESLSAQFSGKEPLRILVPGNLGVPKGQNLVKEVAERDKGRFFEFHVLGRTNLKPAPGIVLHGEYGREDLLERISIIKPHVSAVLSLWNETWCHTLTESWVAGLPVIATDFPTVGGRIRETGAGWLINHKDSNAIYDELIRISTSPTEVTERQQSAVAAQKLIAQNTTEAMSEQYKSVYALAHTVRRAEAIVN